MVALDNYYNKVMVELENKTQLSTRVKGLLDQVIEKLPNEEQFGMIGNIYIGSREWVVEILKDAESEYPTGPAITFAPKDANIEFSIAENLEDSSFFITFVVDDLDEKSDDQIIGLIAHKISELSYAWKTWQSTNNLENQEERVMMFKQNMKANLRIGSKEVEELERNVDEEAKRLGFSKELLAYDIQ